MRRARVISGKHGLSSFMLALNEAEIKAEATPVHMNHEKTATIVLKNKGEISIGMVHARQINKTTTLILPTEEEWRQDTSEDHDLG